MELWQILLIVFSALVLVLIIILLVLHIRKSNKIKASNLKVKEQVRASADALADKFGGNDNIVKISSSGSRVTVLLKEKDKIDKAGIEKEFSNVMYMGDKVVFVIGTESAEFSKLLQNRLNTTEK